MQRFAWSATFFAIPCRQLPRRGAAQQELLLLLRGMANKDSEHGQHHGSYLFLNPILHMTTVDDGVVQS